MKKKTFLIILVLLVNVFYPAKLSAQSGVGTSWLVESPDLDKLCIENATSVSRYWKDNKYVVLKTHNGNAADHEFHILTAIDQSDGTTNCQMNYLFTVPNEQGGGFNSGVSYIKNNMQFKIINDILYFYAGTKERYGSFLAYDLNTQEFLDSDYLLTGKSIIFNNFVKIDNYFYFLVELHNHERSVISYNGDLDNPLAENIPTDGNFIEQVLFRTDLDFGNFELIYHFKDTEKDVLSNNLDPLQVDSAGRFLVGLREKRMDNGWDDPLWIIGNRYNSRYVLIDPNTKSILQDETFADHVLMVPGLDNDYYLGFSTYQINYVDPYVGGEINYKKRAYLAHYDSDWNELARSESLVIPAPMNGGNYFSHITLFDDRIMIQFGDDPRLWEMYYGATAILDRDLRRREFYSGTLADYTGIMNQSVKCARRYGFSKDGYYTTGLFSYNVNSGPRINMPPAVDVSLNELEFPNELGQWGFSYHYSFPDLSDYVFTPQLGTHGASIISEKGLGQQGEPVDMPSSYTIVTTETLTEGEMINPEYILGGVPNGWLALYGQDCQDGWDKTDYRDHNIGVLRKDSFGNFFTTIEINNQGDNYFGATPPMEQSNNGKYYRIYLTNDQSLSVDDVLDETMLSLYPNPTSGLVRLGGLKYQTDIAIYTVAGVLVHRQQTEPYQTTADLTLDLSPGIYIVQLNNESGHSSKKLVIQ